MDKYYDRPDEDQPSGLSHPQAIYPPYQRDNDSDEDEEKDAPRESRRMEHLPMGPMQVHTTEEATTTSIPRTASHIRQYSSSALPLVNKPYDSQYSAAVGGSSIERPYTPYDSTVAPTTNSASGGGFFASNLNRLKMNTTGRRGQARGWQLTWSYAPDWILTIGITAAFYLLDSVDGFKREFDLNDTSIQHTFAIKERVPNWMLMVICAGAPIVLMPIVNLLTVRSYWDWHNSSLGVILSLGLTGTVTNLVKICVGRPRPDVIDRCQPAPGSQNASPYGLVTVAICTQTDHEIMKDGFRSFPSGHSSLSFAGLGFLSFYLAGKLHLWDKRGHTGKAWLSLAPLLGAALVAVSRTMDYRHHWQDVLTGGILGLVLSFFAYRQYYPSLTHPLSHQPYSPRIPREEMRRQQSTLPSTRQDASGAPYGYTQQVPSSSLDRGSPSPPYGGSLTTGGYDPAAYSGGLPPGAGYAGGPPGGSAAAATFQKSQLHPYSNQKMPPQRQFSTPINASPYEARVYSATDEPMASVVAPVSGPEAASSSTSNPFDDDDYSAPAILASSPHGSPPKGPGPDGTLPRPEDHAALHT